MFNIRIMFAIFKYNLRLKIIFLKNDFLKNLINKTFKFNLFFDFKKMNNVNLI